VSCKTGRIGLKYDQHLVEHSFESMSKLRVNQARSLACFRHHCESLTTSLVGDAFEPESLAVDPDFL
jgi:hypothetical protein